MNMLFLDGGGQEVEGAAVQAALAKHSNGLPAMIAAVMAAAVKQAAAGDKVQPVMYVHKLLEREQLPAGLDQALERVLQGTVGQPYLRQMTERVNAVVAEWVEELEAGRAAALLLLTADTTAEQRTSMLAEIGRRRATRRWEAIDRALRESGKTRARPARESGLEESRRVDRQGHRGHVKLEGSDAGPAVQDKSSKVAQRVQAATPNVTIGVGGVAQVGRGVAKARKAAGAAAVVVVSGSELIAAAADLEPRKLRRRGLPAAAMVRAVSLPLRGETEGGGGTDGAPWAVALRATRTPQWRNANHLARSGEVLQASVGRALCGECEEVRHSAKCAACRHVHACDACLARDGCWRCMSFDTDEDYAEAWDEWVGEQGRLRWAEWGWRAAGAEAWRCGGCGGQALCCCAHCGAWVCDGRECGWHGTAEGGCGMELGADTKAAMSEHLEAAKVITGCDVAMAAVFTSTVLNTKVQGRPRRVPFGALGVWSQEPVRPRRWGAALLKAQQAHRHVEGEGVQVNSAARAQAGWGPAAGELGLAKPACMAVNHELLKARARSMGLSSGETASASQREQLRAVAVRADEPMSTFRAGHGHAIFVVGRGAPWHDAYLSTEERARLDETPRLLLLRQVYTPLQVHSAAGLGGHGAVWRGVPRRVLQLCEGWWQRRRAGGGPLRVTSVGTGTLDGALDGLVGAVRGVLPVHVEMAAETDADAQAGWRHCYMSSAARQHDGGGVTVRGGRWSHAALDGRSAMASRDAPASEWLNVTVTCSPMSPASRWVEAQRAVAVFQLCCDVWDILYQRMAGKPLRSLPVVVEIEMVEAQSWQLGGLAGLLWGGVLLSLPYCTLVQEICPAVVFHRPVRRGRVFHVMVRRDVAMEEVARHGSDWRAWEVWARQGKSDEELEAWLGGMRDEGGDEGGEGGGD